MREADFAQARRGQVQYFFAVFSLWIEPERPVTSITFSAYWRLVRRNRNFRRLWLAQIVSEIGDWFYIARHLQSAAPANRQGGLGSAGTGAPGVTADFRRTDRGCSE